MGTMEEWNEMDKKIKTIEGAESLFIRRQKKRSFTKDFGTD